MNLVPCLYCHHRLTWENNTGDTPEVIYFCAGCGRFSKFNSTFQLCVLTDDEHNEFKQYRSVRNLELFYQSFSEKMQKAAGANWQDTFSRWLGV